MAPGVPRPSEFFGWTGWRVEDCAGLRVGTLEAVYAEPGCAAPAWFLVRLGRYSSRYALTPPSEALGWLGHVTLPWTRARIEGTPALYVPPGAVEPDLAAALRRHYVLADACDAPMIARRTTA